MKTQTVKCVVVLGAIMISMMELIWATTVHADADVDFSGTLVEEPCDIASGDRGQSVEVDFGTIPNKNLYYYGKSTTENFSITLSNCDTTLGSKASFKFMGTPDSEQPGLLSIKPEGQTDEMGAAIVILDSTGTPLEINSVGQQTSISSGDNVISFSAYVQPSPRAVTDHALKIGAFSATATFEVEYE